MSTPILGAAELTEGQGLPETTENERGRRFEQGAQHFNVKDKDLTAPPGSPAQGDCYIVAAGATGTWAGKDKHLAFYMNTGWQFIAPLTGFRAYVQDEGVDYRYVTGAWSATGGGGDLLAANNLSDLANAEAARRNLGGAPIRTVAGTSDTPGLADAEGYIRCTSGSPVVVTIPPNSSVAFTVKTVISIEQAGAGTVTLAADAGVTLNSRGGLLSLAGQYAVAQVKKVATDTWTVIGDVA